MPKTARSAYEVPRNNLRAAIAYFEQNLVHGTLRPGDARVLMRLQDDPAALMDAMIEVCERTGLEAPTGEP